MNTAPDTSAKDYLDILSRLTLNPRDAAPAIEYVASLNSDQQKELLALADAHHVVIRALTVISQTSNTGSSGAPSSGAPVRGWAEATIAAERARIANALPRLGAICRELEAAGAPCVVMKSLDHWPDL